MSLSATPSKVQYVLGQHRNNKVIFIKYPYDAALNARVKKLVGAKYSRTHSCYYVIDNEHYRQLFKLPIAPLSSKVPAELCAANQQHWLAAVKHMEQRMLCPNTIRTYGNELAIYFKTLKQTDAATLTPTRINDYIHYCITTLRLSENQVHSRINAIKYYYVKVLGQENFGIHVPRPTKAKQLPKAYSIETVAAILNTTSNLKHYYVLALCYGTGMRISELVALQLTHIDLSDSKIFIVRAKGKKDRVVGFPASLLPLHKQYVAAYAPKKYLFEGQYGGMYCVRSIQQVFNQAKDKAGVLAEGGIHSFRHSYATHLLEAGTDISLIQRLLGHNDINTTLIYTSISKKELTQVVSPLDKLIGKKSLQMARFSKPPSSI